MNNRYDPSLFILSFALSFFLLVAWEGNFRTLSNPLEAAPENSVWESLF